MTTDYDRISADDLSCQTEDRLDQTEGEQTTGPANKARKPRKTAKKAAAKKAVAKKAVAKKAASQKPVKKASKKASVKKTSAKKAAPKNTAPKNTAKRTVTATKAEARAQAVQDAETRLVLRQQIDAIFDERASQTAKGRAAQKRAAKTEAKGLVWTLSALALAACGGGGGGSPAPVTGSDAGPTRPQPSTGGTLLPPVKPEELTEDILNQHRDDFLKDREARQVDDAGFGTGYSVGRFTQDGTFQVETARIDPSMMISARVGGIIDPTTGIQVRGGGTDGDGVYEGPANWYSLPGELLITPLTNILARRYALEMARGRDMDTNDYLQSVLDELFAGSGVSVSLDDILNPVNYILPNKAEHDLMVEKEADGTVLSSVSSFNDGIPSLGRFAEGTSNERDRTLADVKIADVIARKSLELFIQDTDWYTDNNIDELSATAREAAIEAELNRLIQLARDIEEGKPIAIPQPNIEVAEAQSLNAVVFTFNIDHFGFSDPGGNDADPNDDGDQPCSVQCRQR